MPTDESREIAYTPQEVAAYTLEEIQRRRDNQRRSIPMGVPAIDKRMKPLRPGELITIIARPSNYKSGFAQWWARRIAQEIVEAEGDEVVVYGTTEMSIEELGIYDLAVGARLDASAVADGNVSDEEMSQLEAASLQRAALPLWLVGHSMARRKKRVSISILTIEKALYWIEDHMDFRARVVFLDYMNLMQSERKPGQMSDRRMDCTDLVRAAKDMALAMGCPVVMLAQAKRECDDRDWQLPQMADGMETAAIEQFSDKIISLWMPKVSEAVGGTIETPDREQLVVSENMLLMGLVKQKNGPAGGYFVLGVDFEQNEIRMMELEQEEPWA